MLALTSCSSDDEMQEQSGNGQVRMELTSNITQSRSANTSLQMTQLVAGVQVGVFAKGTYGYISGGNNVLQTADGTGGFTGSPIYFPSGDEAVSVYAYAPYNSSWDEMSGADADFTIATDQSTDNGYLKSDLLRGIPATANSFTKANPTVALNFDHMLAKLTVKFRLGDDADVDLKGATINIVNTLPSTTLNVENGTLGVAKGNATSIKAVTFADDATIFTASAVIVPQAVAAGDFIQVVLTDGRMLNAKLNTEATFASGKAYAYTVNIGAEGAVIELGSTITDWDDNTTELSGDVDIEEAPEVRLYATFGTPGSNATYSAPTYTWTAGNSNLMTCFEFNNGELANYKTLRFTISNLSEGASVRMGYYVGTEWTEFGNGFYSNGEKEIDLTTLGIDLSTVTKISFGGKSGAGGSVDILASEVYLVQGNGATQGGGGQTDDSKLTATFGTPGGNASYSAPTYTWTAGNNNLMSCFEFNNGELAAYSTLTFTISNLSEGSSVRMGYYVGSTFTEFGSGYYSNGTKTVDLTSLGIDLSTVTKISFGGRNGSGSVDIKAAEVFLSK